MRTMGNTIDAQHIGTRTLAADQLYKRRILEREAKATSDPALISVLAHQDKIVSRNQAAIQYGIGRRRPKKPSNQRHRKDFKIPEGFVVCGVSHGRSYSSLAGARMERKQAGFPDVMRHPTTIHLMPVPLSGDLNAATDFCRPRMRASFASFTFGSQIEGRFQHAMKAAVELAAYFPPCELPSYVDPVNRPDEVFALLHWHGIIADPYLTKNQVRRILQKAFPGCNRVCVRSIQPERINDQGEVTHGGQGYFEYSALDKTDVKLDTADQTVAAIAGHAKLSTTWNKRNRFFSMGKPLTVTGVQINPDRVRELELMERLDAVKRNWRKLSYAEQFIHLWFSGLVPMIRKPLTWLKHGISIKDRFLQALFLVRNWSTDDDAQDVDFIDYVAPLRE
jgi:hypothetical protein